MILPLIELQGTSIEIGLQHGKILSDRIKNTIRYYHRIFNRTEEEILDAAKIYRDVIIEFNRDYADEIEAIAKGANVEPLWIYALNSRTEILTQFVSECTAFYFGKSSLLVQNWDWAEDLEKLMVMMRIKRTDGHTILQITEPGIIGKIGINSKGLGVTLNFLHMDGKMCGLPIHITLRHLLDSDSLSDGITNLRDYRYGKSSNIIFANDNGQFINLEFAGDKVTETRDKEVFLHTNHFLADDTLNTDTEKLASSFSRYARAGEMMHEIDHTIDNAKSILADQTNSQLPICRPYILNEDIGNIGTVTSIIMDLSKREIHATRGNPFDNDYIQFKLD